MIAALADTLPDHLRRAYFRGLDTRPRRARAALAAAVTRLHLELSGDDWTVGALEDLAHAAGQAAAGAELPELSALAIRLAIRLDDEGLLTSDEAEALGLAARCLASTNTDTEIPCSISR